MAGFLRDSSLTSAAQQDAAPQFTYTMVILFLFAMTVVFIVSFGFRGKLVSEVSSGTDTSLKKIKRSQKKTRRQRRKMHQIHEVVVDAGSDLEAYLDIEVSMVDERVHDSSVASAKGALAPFAFERRKEQQDSFEVVVVHEQATDADHMYGEDALDVSMDEHCAHSEATCGKRFGEQQCRCRTDAVWGCECCRVYTSALLLAHRAIQTRVAAGPPGLELPGAEVYIRDTADWQSWLAEQPTGM